MIPARLPASAVAIRSRPALAATVLAAALAAAGCGGCGAAGDGGAASASPPHVVLISLDTFRADALGARSDGGHSLTPNLDRFARDAVRFDGAVAPMPFTLASHMSMFTGLDPVVHGVSGERSRLDPAVPTLTEAFQAAGYRTVGWMTNEWLNPEFGFGKGFDSYSRLRHELTYAPRVTNHGLASMETAERDGVPLFLFLHYMDGHSDFPIAGNLLPYYSPEQFRTGPLAGFAPRRFCDAENRCSTAYLEAADREKRPLDAGELALLHGLYEAGLAALDADLGRLFAKLQHSGAYDRSLIVVTSDHGEELREHGKLLHSQVYEESVRVPLLVKLPGSRRGGTRLRDQVEVEDLYPTLLELAGLRVPNDQQGISLAPLVASAGGAARPATDRLGGRAALLQDKLARSRFGLRTPRWKLVYDVVSEHRELYDLAADPGERHDLAAADPERAERMRQRLLRTLRGDRQLARRLGIRKTETEGSQLTAEERARLKALGYL
jgi:arylsulfatase A-like enzyme